MNIGQEVQMLQQEVANGPPLFPPPHTNAVELSEKFKRKDTRAKKKIDCHMLLHYFIRNQAQQEYRKCVINKVVRELWKTTTRNNKLAYNNLCNQINSIINQ
ncbi:hypothetical protein GLOIN_2v1768491 [Rhizophagus clarus]|uniref:Uncharacterized protein n=1 Tax=Rhizophagus clarus TaxID=94130 RepID=A0A8H3QU87_9GLOM|nr:hypothetical protein GLOIN_2v1768491 [Rhizophagus clarus]